MIDVSAFNAAPDFHVVAAGGTRRVYCRASQGAHEHDPTFPLYLARAHAAGLRVGAYHVCWPALHTPQEEADNFLQLHRLLHLCDERPMLDLETGSATARAGAWTSELARLVFQRTGVRCGLYGSPSFVEACRFDVHFASVTPLWQAEYGPKLHVARPWREAAAWQFTSHGRIAGVHGFVDVSHVLNARALDLHVHMLDRLRARV